MNRNSKITFVFAVIIGIFMVGSRPTNSVLPVLGEINAMAASGVSDPVIAPNRGEIVYTCPAGRSCERTGSREWFSVSETGDKFLIDAFGDMDIVSARDAKGAVGVTLSGDVLTFDRPVSGDVLLTLTGNGDAPYGVR